ncbi:MAG: hypothetical protein IGR76_06305 [Synechococcales cyanobacterium T60_A2020_003]|nr:hypothetical protein [Synechococcales cyanobacterium T60_A2020_003]
MKRKIVLGIVTFFLALGAVVLGAQVAVSQNAENVFGVMAQRMAQRMAGDRPCAQWDEDFTNWNDMPHRWGNRNWDDMPHMRGNSDWDDMPHMRGNSDWDDMQVIHQLFVNHDSIQRTVEEIPGGIRAVTESDDPQIAALIQEHVTEMYDRIDEGQGFTMMSPTLPEMFVNAEHYDRQVELTPNGVAITETSEDPEIVALIREHGQEVNEFVAEGMVAMMNAGRCPASEVRR